MNLLGRARAINDPMLAFTRLGSGGLYPRDAEVEAFMDGLLNDH